VLGQMADTEQEGGSHPKELNNRRKQGVKWCLQERSTFLAEVRFQSFWRRALTFQKQGRRDGRVVWPHKAPKVAKAACAGRAELGGGMQRAVLQAEACEAGCQQMSSRRERGGRGKTLSS